MLLLNLHKLCIDMWHLHTKAIGMHKNIRQHTVRTRVCEARHDLLLHVYKSAPCITAMACWLIRR